MTDSLTVHTWPVFTSGTEIARRSKVGWRWRLPLEIEILTSGPDNREPRDVEVTRDVDVHTRMSGIVRLNYAVKTLNLERFGTKH